MAIKLNKKLNIPHLDVWVCDCGTDIPVAKGSPKPRCEYCRRVREHDKNVQRMLQKIAGCSKTTRQIIENEILEQTQKTGGDDKMNTDTLVAELNKLRDKYKMFREDEDTIKVAIHRLKAYKKIVKEHRCEE